MIRLVETLQNRKHALVERNQALRARLDTFHEDISIITTGEFSVVAYYIRLSTLK